MFTIRLSARQATLDAIGIPVRTADWRNGEIDVGLLGQVEGGISRLGANGAYATQGCHTAIAEQRVRATIQPTDVAVRVGMFISARRFHVIAPFA